MSDDEAGSFIAGLMLGVVFTAVVSCVGFKDHVSSTTWKRADAMCMINKGAESVEAKTMRGIVVVKCGDGTVMVRTFADG